MQQTPTRRFRGSCLAAATLLLCGCASGALSQTKRPVGGAAPAVDTSFFGGLKWNNIGPNRGGRSIAVGGSTARPLEYYFGATGGGVWKTVDGGTTWKPVSDGQLGRSSVGAVGVCEANPDVVYIGTGETQLRGNIQPGDGVYRTPDGGKTWTHIGLREARNIARVRVHPTDCNTAYAAAFGHYGDPNAERGIFKTTDGGATWRKVLFRNAETGGVDLSINPHDPNEIYAALWEAWRKPWGMSSGGRGSGLFRSTDGGDHWTELTRNPGLPQEPVIGKIGVSISPADPKRVYAIVEANSGGVFRSDDSGATWEQVNDDRKLRQRAFYYTRIQADPKDRERVYVMNVQFWRSDDGGKTFPKAIEVPHGDNHDLWIAADNPQRMIEGNDGGANVSWNGGETWTEQDYPTAQMYRVTTTSHNPYFVCGGQQDNSTVCVPSKGWNHLLARGMGGRAKKGDYGFSVGGCESGYIAPHPVKPDIFYSGCYGGALDRYDHATGETRGVNVWPDNPMGHSAEDLRERSQWTFPILFDPQDPQTLYTTTQHVWRTRNEGQTWERISPDLTRHAPETIGPSGGPVTRDQTGVETYATVFALAPSRTEPDVIWAGSDDGLVHVTRDNGATWQNVTPAGVPGFLKITTVEDSPHRPGAAFMVGHRFLLGDAAPYVYRTTDYGRSWTPIVAGLPADEISRSIREDPVRPGLLYLGTESGVWVSFDAGDHWQRLQMNLPTAQVADLAVRDHDLVIATHGRSFWILPNIDVLRQLSPAVTRQRAHLFEPAPAVRTVDDGVTIDYYLRKPARRVTLEFLGPDGQVIRRFSGTPADTANTKKDDEDEEDEEDEDEFGIREDPHPPARVGMNRFVWDLRYPGYTDFPGMILWAGRTVAPTAVPGRYQVRLIVDGKMQTKPFEIRMDPRVTGVTVAELQKRFDLAMRVRDRVSEANQAVLLMRGIKQQIEQRLQKTDDPQVVQRGRALVERLDEVEQEIYQVRSRSRQDPLNYPIKVNNKLAALLGHVEGAEAGPTDQAYAVFDYLSGTLAREISRMEQVLAQDLPPLNEQLARKRLKPVERRPLEVRRGTGRAARDAGDEEEEEARDW